MSNDSDENSNDDFKTSIFNQEVEGSPGERVKRDPRPEEIDDIAEFIGSEVGLAKSVLKKEKLNRYAPPGQKWEWEDYQLDYLDTNENYICNKARRVGMSAAISAKAFTRGMLTQGRNYTAIFTSYKQDEAIGKIEYVRQYLQALPMRFQKQIVREPMQLIEWKNHDGTRVKIMSHAQRPIRGIEGDIFMDELAFYQYDDEIYESALNSTGMSGSTIDIISTPFGKKGKYYDIMENKDRYPGFKRNMIYWWECKRYLKDKDDKDAFLAWVKQAAPHTESVEERVYEFGNKNLINLFENNDKESFRQELEGYFVDEQSSYISKDMIMKCMFPVDLNRIDNYSPRETDFNIPIEEALGGDDLKWPIVKKYDKIKFKQYSSLEELYSAVKRGEISGNLFGGADIGTKRNSTEFVIVEEIQISDEETIQVERFHLSKKGWKLPEQESYFNKVLSQGFLRKLRMDITGLGTQMGQALEDRWGDNLFEGLVMAGSNKKHEREMFNLRARMENDQIALGYNKDKIHSIHSVKRVITDSKNISYRAPDTKKGHADYAWAIAFASRGGTPFGQSPSYMSVQAYDDLSMDMKKNMDNAGVDAGFADDFKRKHLTPDNKKVLDRAGIDFNDKKSINKVFNPGSFISNHDE